MKKLSLIAALLSLTWLQGAHADTIARVNGAAIDSADVDRQVQLIVTQSKQQISDSPQLRAMLTQRLATQQLILQDARRMGLDKSAAYQSVLQRARADAQQKGLATQPGFEADWKTFQENMLIEAYLDAIFKEHPITEADTKKAYEQLKATYDGTSEIRLASIFTQDEAGASAALAELRAGQSFSSVAKKRSVAPSAANGGLEAGYLSLVDMRAETPDLYNAVKDLPVGKYTLTPLHTDKLNTIFQVNSKRVIHIEPYAKIKDSLNARLHNALISERIAKLYQNANIQ